jgi:hypothetical protein
MVLVDRQSVAGLEARGQQFVGLAHPVGSTAVAGADLAGGQQMHPVRRPGCIGRNGDRRAKDYGTGDAGGMMRNVLFWVAKHRARLAAPSPSNHARAGGH